MTHPLLLCTNSFRDIPLSELAVSSSDWGYDGFEAVLGVGHWDLVAHSKDGGFLESTRDLLGRHRLDIPIIAAHGLTTVLCDPIGQYSRKILPTHVYGDGDPNGIRDRAMVEIQSLLRSAEAFGIGLLSGFTGSPIWSRFWTYPAPNSEEIEDAFNLVATRFQPVLDGCLDSGIRFALEVHPGQMAFDVSSASRLLDSLGGHQALGFTLDPAHLVWQGVDPVQSVRAFPDRIWHIHLRDVFTRLDGTSSLLNPSIHPHPASHLGGVRGSAPVEYRAPGRGSIDWDSLIRELARVGYAGAFSVEAKDPDLDRAVIAAESASWARRLLRLLSGRHSA